MGEILTGAALQEAMMRGFREYFLPAPQVEVAGDVWENLSRKPEMDDIWSQFLRKPNTELSDIELRRVDAYLVLAVTDAYAQVLAVHGAQVDSTVLAGQIKSFAARHRHTDDMEKIALDLCEPLLVTAGEDLCRICSDQQVAETWKFFAGNMRYDVVEQVGGGIDILARGLLHEAVNDPHILHVHLAAKQNLPRSGTHFSDALKQVFDQTFPPNDLADIRDRLKGDPKAVLSDDETYAIRMESARVAVYAYADVLAAQGANATLKEMSTHIGKFKAEHTAEDAPNVFAARIKAMLRNISNKHHAVTDTREITRGIEYFQDTLRMNPNNPQADVVNEFSDYLAGFVDNNLAAKQAFMRRQEERHRSAS